MIGYLLRTTLFCSSEQFDSHVTRDFQYVTDLAAGNFVSPLYISFDGIPFTMVDLFVCSLLYLGS